MINILIFKEFLIRQHAESGYMYVCDFGNQYWNEYLRQKSSYTFIKELVKQTGTHRYDLTQRDTTGSMWIHPEIAIHMTRLNFPHLSTYLSTVIKNKIIPVEEKVETRDTHRNNIAKMHGGITEIVYQSGIVDVFSDTDICEVNSCSIWQKALSNIMTHSIYFPDHNKHLYLYDAYGGDKEVIRKVCFNHGVSVKFKH